MVRPHANFSFVMDDVERLLQLHDRGTEGRRGRPSRQLAVFKRAAIILEVTAWESFIEDAIRTSAMNALEFASSPSELQTWFNSAAHKWLASTPKPPSVAEWTGDGWRMLLGGRLCSQL